MNKYPSSHVGEVVSLRLGAFYSAFRAENIALWFLFLYILFEYIRPQNMYPVLDILPWGQVALIGCLASILATGSKALGFGAMDKIFILITCTVILSAIFAWYSPVSLKYWSTYTSWVLMFLCVVKIITTPKKMLLFIIFFLLINFKLSEFGARSFAMRGFSFTHWGLSGSPGWFRNSGELALQMTVAFAVGTCLLLGLRKYVENKKRWWVLLFLFPGTAFITVIGSSSRGGQLALLCVLVILFLGGTKFFRKSILVIVVFVLAMTMIPDEQMARFDTVGNDRTSELRLMHWRNAREVFREHPWGIGYMNWKSYYYANFDVEKIEEIHNTPLQAFVELGVFGGLVFHLALIMALVMNGKTRRDMIGLGGKDGDTMAAVAQGINVGLVGTFVAAFFMSVLYYPMYWLAFALTSALRHISKDLLYKSETIP